MRSADENQHDSIRPNLLSGGRRRFVEDDNILARLERDSARQALGNRSRAGRHVAAAALVLLLVVSIAWIAYENVATTHVVSMTRAALENEPVMVSGINADGNAVATTGSAAGSRQAPATTPILTGPHPHVAASQAQVAQTLPGSAPITTSDALPPLVLLEHREAAPVKPATPERAARAAAPDSPRRTRSARRIRPAASSASVQESALPRTVAASRPRKAGAASAAADAAAIDTDVALLSAIIIHDSTHAAEKAQLENATECTRAAGRRCSPKKLSP